MNQIIDAIKEAQMLNSAIETCECYGEGRYLTEAMNSAIDYVADQMNVTHFQACSAIFG